MQIVNQQDREREREREKLQYFNGLWLQSGAAYGDEKIGRKKRIWRKSCLGHEPILQKDIFKN